jgi:hypothetical protein
MCFYFKEIKNTLREYFTLQAASLHLDHMIMCVSLSGNQCSQELPQTGLELPMMRMHCLCMALCVQWHEVSRSGCFENERADLEKE